MTALRREQTTKSASIVLVFSLWLTMVANARLSAAAEPGDSGDQPNLRPTIATDEPAARRDDTVSDPSSICQLIESAAVAN